jgi:glycosyltransferase involved in cell wall biosynthesis
VNFRGERRSVDPVVSIIMPVLNAAEFLEAQFRSLAAQTFARPWELLVADNGSTDGSRLIAEAWCARIPNARVLDAGTCQGPGSVRNLAALAARAALLAFCDADDVVDSRWLEACVAAAEHHPFIAGAIDLVALNDRPHPWDLVMLKKPQTILGFRPFANAANMAISKPLFLDAGGFPEDMPVSGDVDLSWRLQLAGHQLHFEPSAVVAKRSRHDIAGAWHQSVQRGMADVELYRRYRGVGLKRSPLRAAAARYLRRTARESAAVASSFRFRHRFIWVAATARRWGRFRGSVRARTLYL